MRGEEVVGIYLILYGVVDALVSGFSAALLVTAVVGAIFLFPKSQPASDAVRLLFFGWLIIQIAIAIFASPSEVISLSFLGFLLSAGGLAALMFEGMSGRKTIPPACVALVGESILWMTNR